MEDIRRYPLRSPASSAFSALLCAGLAMALSACGAGGGAGSTGRAGAAGGYGQGGGPGGPGGARSAAISVMAQQAPEGPLTVVSDTSGTVNPVTQSKVAAQIAGTVAKILHKSGDWVKAGETVIQLDDSQLRLSVVTASSALDNAKIVLSTNEDTTSQANPRLELQVQSAEAALALAQKNFDSTQALFKAGGATASQVDGAESQLQTAQANLASVKTDLDQNRKAGTQSLAMLRIAVDQAANQLRQAELNLQFASVKAPFAGQVSIVSVNPGEYLGVNSTAFVLVSPDKEVDFNVPPTDAVHLGIGTKLDFSFEGRVFPITVRQPPSAPVSGMVPMVASAPQSFPIAYGAVGAISYSLILARGILIPIAALQSNEDKNYVFSIEGGKATKRPVVVVSESGVLAAVSGIAPGSQVIVNPPPGLLNGSQVAAVQVGAAGQAAGQAGRP